MLQHKRLIQYAIVGISLACVPSHASIIQSMTIEEIGAASGGVGTSSNLNMGGEARAYDVNGILFADSPFFFVSAGSTDGVLIMGAAQGNNAFTLGFNHPGIIGLGGELNTTRGAPTGSITNGTMTLDLSGFTTDFGGLSFAFSPDNAPITAVSMIDANHYYYTADWSHVVKDGEVFNLTTGATHLGFTGWTLGAHLEGIATVPEPGTLWLISASAAGLLISRRRKNA